MTNEEKILVNNLVHAVGRLLNDKYTEGDTKTRNELWRDMHYKQQVLFEYMHNLKSPKP